VILLTFDDCRPAEWAGIIPDMKRLAIRATFYVSNQESITADGWAQLHELQDAGHSIQFHGFRHLNASKATDFEAYIQVEIVPGIEAMYRHGFDPTHFAYPYGHWTEASHKKLLPFFTSLRTLNAVNPMPYERIWGGFDWDTRKHDATVAKSVGPGGITPIVMHRPDPARLVALANGRADAFVTVEDIKWPR
jgi:peptidoglycan/xylan/chitin deacetylase (PgdA/CDA1 family)